MTGVDPVRGVVRTILGYDAVDAILAPGALVALRLLLPRMGARTLLLSDREYYRPEHFPEMTVHVAPFEDLPEEAGRLAPDAVLASVVSWGGEVADVRELTRGIRARAGSAPLVCLDWCQAGAAGFPPAQDVGADVIVGDTTKWLIPAKASDRLAFLVGGERVRPSLESSFAGLYLSGGCRTTREARWVDPRTRDAVTDALEDTRPDRSRISEWHRANMELAHRIAGRNGLVDPESALLWFPGRTRGELDLEGLPSERLVWTMDSGVRVQCQAAP